MMLNIKGKEHDRDEQINKFNQNVYVHVSNVNLPGKQDGWVFDFIVMHPRIIICSQCPGLTSRAFLFIQKKWGIIKMPKNILFKEYKTQDYIEIAEQTEKWVDATKVTAKDGIYWVQSPDSDEDFTDYPMLTPKALYGGSAGIGLFYLRLYQVTENEEYLNNAKAAADHIIATDVGTQFYEEILNAKNPVTDKLIHVKNMPGWKIGFYNGPTGGAYLALKLYEVTGEEKYKAYVIKTAEDVLAVAKESPDGIYWSEQNDLCGDAGLVIFLISTWKITGDEKYIDAAKSFGDFLLKKSAPAPHGGRYWNVVDLTIIDFPKDVFWVNMAHGTSGIGWVYTILYNATKEERYLNAAIDAAKYIEDIAVGDDEAVLIPYLDSLERGTSTEFYYLSQCHGPAGTSILFQALYLITKEQEYLDWAKKMSRGIIKAGAPEHFSRGYWPSQSLCCGTPGILEHFVSMYKITGEDEFLRYAKRTARFIISQSFVGDEPGDIYKQQKKRNWYGNWWRTIPQNVHSYTGLYVGTTGNAWSLLSLAAVLEGKEWIQTVEYNYFN